VRCAHNGIHRAIEKLLVLASETVEVARNIPIYLGIEFNFTSQIVVLVSLITYITMMIYNVRERNKREINIDYDGSFSYETPLTPAHAREANDALRSSFGGKRSLKQYRALIENNNHVSTAIIDENGEMCGYFDVFPLHYDFGEKLISGVRTELEMVPDIEYDKSAEQNAMHIYIGAIFNLENNNAAKRHAISFCLQRRL
jgi:hypothetical protein